MKNHTAVWNRAASACLDETTCYIALDNLDCAPFVFTASNASKKALLIEFVINNVGNFNLD